jgi:hypothetical protein
MTQSYTETLRENFSNMHTDMLLERKESGSLTDEAKKILEEELIKRGLTEEKIKQMNAEEKHEPINELNGIKGWLLLVGLGLIISPVKIIISLFTTYAPMFKNGAWERLTTAGSSYYIPNFQELATVEIIYNICITVAGIYLIYLFTNKKKEFPNIFIAVTIISIVAIPIDSFITTLVIKDSEFFDYETVKDFMKLIVNAGVWVPYMLISKRVKHTFIK